MPGQSTARKLTLTVDVSGKVPVVQCRGRLVAGETDRFYDDLKQLMCMYKEIVVNFAEVTHLDSMGLGTLARLYVHAKSAGAVLELTHVGKSVRQLLGITHMLSVFQMVGENNIRMG
ncbi:MAG TPA: STAS domain-containing protein [Candidatus Eisenbacteria bacterium]|nr:STAS domain-containing protein [Candidatus Eisenbacteria bacterium]